MRVLATHDCGRHVPRAACAFFGYPAGPKNILAVVDVDDTIVELDETNNEHLHEATFVP